MSRVRLLASHHLPEGVHRLSTVAGARALVWVDGQPIWTRETHALEPVAPRSASAGGDLTGLRIWEAAPLLISYITQHEHRLLRDRRVIELGAGTGAVGIAAAALGTGSVLLTDADTTAHVACMETGGWRETSTLSLIAENIALNQTTDVGARASVAQLVWGSPGCAARLGKFDTIVASDTLYYEPSETYRSLADSIRALAAPAATVVLAFKERHGRERTFARWLTEEGGGFEVVQEEQSAGALWLLELAAPPCRRKWVSSTVAALRGKRSMT